MDKQLKSKNRVTGNKVLNLKPNYNDLEKLKRYVSKNYNLEERVINDCDKYYRR